VPIDAPQPIAMDDKDNANPTILNASDLPSRHRESSVKKREDGGTGLFDDLIPHYTYLSDPFDQPLSASDSDDDSVEDIDEQEVYGQSYLQSSPDTCQGPLCFEAELADFGHCRSDLIHF
jgi:hypothetical protein